MLPDGPGSNGSLYGLIPKKEMGCSRMARKQGTKAKYG